MTITAAFICELKKIFWRPKYQIMLGIYAAIGLVSGMMGAAGYRIRTLTEYSYSVASPNVVYGALSAYRSFLIPLAVFMLAADVFTHELESKSIKCVLVRPVSRFGAYSAKCLAILCYVAVALCVSLLVVAAWQLYSEGIAGNNAVDAQNLFIDELRVRGAGTASLSDRASMAAEAFAAYALTLIPMAAFIAFAAFIAVSFKSPSLVMFLCIASNLALSFVGTFNSAAGAVLFTSYTGWYRMWLGERLPLRNILTAAGIMLSSCAAFFGFGWSIFEKKEI